MKDNVNVVYAYIIYMHSFAIIICNLMHCQILSWTSMSYHVRKSEKHQARLLILGKEFKL